MTAKFMQEQANRWISCDYDIKYDYILVDQQNVWTGADSHRQTLSQGLLTCHGLKGYTADIGVKPLEMGCE